MKTFGKKLICTLLCLVMVLQLLPWSAMAIELPLGKHDGLILEFETDAAMQLFSLVYGGEDLGGNMLLIEGSYSEAKKYEKMEGVVSVTYNYTFETAAYNGEYDQEPDDPYFGQQLYPDDQYTWRSIAASADSLENFEFTQIRVGVLDTGIDGTHEDLQSRVVAGYDAVSGAKIPDGINSDVAYDAHGTKVAGLIAAEAYNGKGIAGVAGKFPIELVPIRALDANGQGKIADIVRGIYWAIDNDIDIINMSFGARLPYYPAALGKATKAAYENGLVMIAAAGNEGNKTFEGYYPACLENVRAVVSSSAAGANQKADYSNDVPYNMKDFYSQGFRYTGCCGTDLVTTTTGNQYDTFTGTSASCAVITGYWALMSTITGGRENPFAHYDMGYVMNQAMGRYNYYSMTDYNFRYAVGDLIEQSIIDLRYNKMQCMVESNDILSEEQTVVATVAVGEELVADVTLVFYDDYYEEVYSTEPIENDGTNPSVYTFTVNTKDIPDGDYYMKACFRTWEEKEKGYIPQNASNYVERQVTVQNSLASAVARVLAYDAEGNEIYANILVIDPNTKKIVAELSFDTYENVMHNTVKSSLFKNGKLTFAIYESGCLYQLTTGFAQEIKLGVEAQETSLVFKNSAVTLAGASVYIGGPAGMVELGTTDENGALNVTMMPGSYDLYVADSKNGYFVHCVAEQDGDQLELTFDDAISAAQPYKVDVADKLSQYDYYSIGFSNVDTKNISKTAGLGWVSSAIDTIYLTPGSYYMLVGIYDAYFSEGNETEIDTHEYLETIHVLGLMDTATDKIDFDPTVLKAHLLLEQDYVLYGEDLSFNFHLTNNQNKPILSGEALNYSQFGVFSDVENWENGIDLEVYDSEDNWLWGVLDYEYYKGSGVFYTTRYEPLPMEEATYTLLLYYSFWQDRSDYVDCFTYQSVEDPKEILVKEGQTFTIMPYCTSDYDFYPMSVTTLVGGEEVEVKSMTGDGEKYVFNTNKLKKGDPLFVQYYAWDSAGCYYYYEVYEYDPEMPVVFAQAPGAMGMFKLYYGEETMESASTTISTEYGDFTYILAASSYDDCYVPAGRYTIAGMSYAGRDEETYTDIYFAYCTELYIDAGQMTELTFNPENTSNKYVILERTDMSLLEFKLVKGDTAISIDPFDDWMPDSFIISKAEDIDDVQIRYAYLPDFENSWDSDVISSMGMEYTGTLDFLDESEMYLDNISITDFAVDLSDCAFTNQKDTVVPLTAKAANGIIIRNMALKNYEKRWLDDDRMRYEMAITDVKDYLPQVEYRKAGGEWITADNVTWEGANLGKLEPGQYEIRFKLHDDPENGVKAQETYAVFAVTGEDAPAEHSITIYAPATASEEITITLMGNAGASVVVHYTTPDGAEKMLEAVTLSASGRATVTLKTEAEGDYLLWAVSTLYPGEEGLTATSETITVTCDQAIPNQVANFKVTAQGNNALLLTWDEVTDAKILWIYREGVQLGYLSTELCQYLDEGLSTDRTYTYYIIAENEAGIQGPAAYASARPTAVADTTAPTTPAQLQAEVKGTSITVTWTRSTDNVGVAFYRLFRDGQVVYEGTKRSFTDSGLQKETTYTYDVQAVDASGNASAKTQPVSATTDAKYELQDVSANIEVNRLGDVTGNELELFANAGLDATRVYAQIAYTRKNATKAISNEQKTATVELAKTGYYWGAVWDISDVLSIQSVTIYAYEGETLMDSKEVEGFPMLVSSPAIVQLNVPNAPYAPEFLQGGKIILTDTENNLVYTKDIIATMETYDYEFTGLSAGIYSLKVLIGGEAYYYERNILLETGVGFYREVNVEGLIRLKAKSGDLMYTIPGKSMLVNKDGYLQVRTGDSAFWVDSSITLVRNVEEMAAHGDKLYRVPANYTVNRVEGVHEYELPAYEDLEALNAFNLKVQLNAPYSNVGLKDMPIQVYGLNEKGNYFIQTLRADENGYIEAAWPGEYVKNLTLTQSSLYWTDSKGNRAQFTGTSTMVKDIATDGSDIITMDLPEIVEEEIELQIYGVFQTRGMTGTISSGGNNYYLEFDDVGNAKTTVRWNYSTNTATIIINSGVFDGAIVKQQSFNISHPGWNYILLQAESKVEQTYTVTIREEHDLYVPDGELRVSTGYGAEYYEFHGDRASVTFYSDENVRQHYKDGSYWEEKLYGERSASASFDLYFETDTHIFNGYIGRTTRPGFSQSAPNEADYWSKRWNSELKEHELVFDSESYAAAMNGYNEAIAEYDQAMSEWESNLAFNGLTYSADIKLNFTNLEKNMGYVVLYYDHASTGAPFMWYTGLSTKYPTIRFYGKEYPEKGMTMVVFPVHSVKNSAFNVQIFDDVPLSAWQDYEGVDVFTINRFDDVRPTYELTTPKVLKLGVMTDLVGNDITSDVSATRYLAGKLLYQDTVRQNSRVILYDYDGDEVLLIPETVVSPERIQAYKDHHAANGDVLCVVAKLDSTITAPISKQFGFQSKYKVELRLPSGGTVPTETIYYGLYTNGTNQKTNGYWFSGYYSELHASVSTKYSAWQSRFGAYTVHIDRPLGTQEILAGWLNDSVLKSGGAGLEEGFGSNYEFWKENGVCYELDITKANTDVLVLTADSQYAAQIINAATKISWWSFNDGICHLIVEQQLSDETDLVLLMPKGTYDLGGATMDGAGAVYLDKAKDASSLTRMTLKIEEADLRNDPYIRVYTVSDTGERKLVAAREIKIPGFRVSYDDTISTNEVGLHGTYVYLERLYAFFGQNFGDDTQLFNYTTTGGAAGYEYKTLTNTGMTLEEYKSKYPAEGAGIALLFGFNGKYIAFETPVDDFAVAMKVDNEDVLWRVQKFVDSAVEDSDISCSFPLPKEAFAVSSGLSSSSGSGNPGGSGSSGGSSGIYIPPITPDDGEEEQMPTVVDGYIYFPSSFLAKYGLYDANTNTGFLPIGMVEPKSYPHSYDIDIRFRYKDTDGEIKEHHFMDESIVLHYEAPVLKTWEVTSYEAGRAYTSVEANAIHSYEERQKFEEVHNNVPLAQLGVSNVFKVDAWFDKPEEVCNVYAIANLTAHASGERIIKLEYDSEKGCYTGVGVVGDAVNKPINFSVVFDYVDERWTDNMVPISVNDLKGSVENRDEQSEVAYVEESDPDNGWTLEYTKQMWQKYVELGADGELSESDIAQITDENGRLYYPKCTYYDEDGNFLGTRQDYIIFGETVENQYSYDMAVVDKGVKQATVTYGATVADDNHATLVITSDDPTLILPMIVPTEMQTAGLFAPVSPMAVVDKGVNVASDFFTFKGAFDAVNAVDSAINNDWYSQLPADAQADYDRYHIIDGVGSAAYTALGATNNVLGTAAGVFDWLMADERAKVEATYEKLAQAHQEYLRSKAMVEELLAEGRRLEEEIRDAGGLTEWLDRLNSLYEGDADWTDYIDWQEFFDYFFPYNKLEWQRRMGDTNMDWRVHDPSGYVFEGIESNRVEGVTATLYQYDEELGQWVVANSEAFDQGPSTQTTNIYGSYGWDVPEGKWKVIFSKDGYVIAESAELVVPPAHFDVNIGIVATVPAQITAVENAKSDDGRKAIKFTFDRPVLVSDVEKLVSVLFNGEALEGTITAKDSDLTTNGNKYSAENTLIEEDLRMAMTFIFVPTEDFDTGASVQLHADSGILTYNGMETVAFDSEYILIPGVAYDPITAMEYTGPATMQVGTKLDLDLNMKLTGSQGVIAWTSMTPGIAAVTAGNMVNAKGTGEAILMAKCGDLTIMVQITIEPEAHTCVYDQKKASSAFLATDYEGNIPDSYYYSCQCGARGAETWRNIPEGHTHSLTLVPGTAPTCTESGTGSYYTCACGMNFTDETAAEEIIYLDLHGYIAPGHNYVDYVCTLCGDKQVDISITKVTLRPGNAGLYFTGSFDIARDVEVARRGIVVSVYNALPVADGSDPRSLWTEGTTSVLVKNILSDKVSSDSNQNRAAMPIYARAYVQLADGSYIYSDVVEVNLRQVVETVDTQWVTLDAAQKEAITAMYEKFSAAMEAWNIPNLKQN